MAWVNSARVFGDRPAMTEFCVHSKTSAPACTSTVSVNYPTSSAVFTVAGTPASIFTLSMLAVLNPGWLTVTV